MLKRGLQDYQIEQFIQLINKQFLSFKFQVGEFYDLIYELTQPSFYSQKVVEKTKEIYLQILTLEQSMQQFPQVNSNINEDFFRSQEQLTQKNKPTYDTKKALMNIMETTKDHQMHIKPPIQSTSSQKIKKEEKIKFDRESLEDFWSILSSYSKSESMDYSFDSKTQNFIIKKEKQNIYQQDQIKQDFDYKQSQDYFLSPKKIQKGKRNYKICSLGVKQDAIRLTRMKGIQEASQVLGVTEKNIRRWIVQGCERKKGGGRKTMDPDMEKRLLDWIEKQVIETDIFPQQKDIKNMAIQFSTIEDFKASKGWCDKFIQRN